MTEAVLREDPSKIPSSLKEAVVDSLINLTFHRISGYGEEGAVVFGARPRSVFASAFLMPPLHAQGFGDEVTQPIRISAHGLDLQVNNGGPGEIRVTPSFQIYVRVLPTVEDLRRPDCAPRFRLTDEVKRDLRTKTSQALKSKWEEISANQQYARRSDHPEWRSIEKSIRDAVCLEMGLPTTLMTLFAPEEEQGPIPAQSDGAAEGVALPSGGAGGLRDEHFSPMDVPHKWERIPLDPALILPLVIDLSQSPEELRATVELASTALNVAVKGAVLTWAASTYGHDWCIRKGLKVRPSEYRGWQQLLEQVRANTLLELVLPDIDLKWTVKVSKDWQNPKRSNVHVSLENISEEAKRGADFVEQSIFQVHLTAALPRTLLAPLKLGRVEPSYRYNKYLEYPAMGFNGGVAEVEEEDRDTIVLLTTWAPRYTQPRIIPKAYPGIDTNMRRLSQPEGLSGLLPIAECLETWFRGLDDSVPLMDGLDAGDFHGQAREQGGFAADKEGWRNEIDAVKAGLAILRESKDHWDKAAARGLQSEDRAAVYEAWLAMNEAMADLMRDRLGNEDGAWRLFQLAFVVAHVPAMASRMPCFRDRYVRDRDDTVTLLYFATGGGKSEAFFGLLAFTLFLDRLRGKSLGVTAMLRYPLRLLTIQQAQRCAKVLAKAERIRRDRLYGGEPFAIGFWVGSGGSPNSHGDPGVDDIPDISEQSADAEAEAALLKENRNYEIQKAAWNKIPTCPFCESRTVLRRFKKLGGVVAHTCSNLACLTNLEGYAPLPFYICDTDIYAIAPSVLLGTVDKLALIGQSFGTLRRIYAMFGAAPLQETTNGRLFIPNEPRQFAGEPGKKHIGLFPAYREGKRLFVDPFPSLIIQDEAHLLDESLGTFAGLFESALDAIFSELAQPLAEVIAYEPDGKTRRRAKVIAASATVSDPDRQLEHLYQRPVPAMQFPYPGESLYESFYAAPAEPRESETERVALKDVEKRAKWGRVYVAFMTNGRAHTATSVAVLANFHTIISELLHLLCSAEEAKRELGRSFLIKATSQSASSSLYKQSLADAAPGQIATLVDLHRIALTYVTNKKGGDQIMAAEFEETRKRHEERGLPFGTLRTELITGSVSQGDIQKTVEDAKFRPPPGAAFEDVSKVLRSILATSAISHGVDVEELNSMFFAGMPSDVAEYIQASSRVGRTHVGFVVLMPTPQRRRDRYIVEVFDSYHRFLERMVSPAAIDRWAGRAIERVLPSFINAYLAGITYVRGILEAPGTDKSGVEDMAWIPNIVRRYDGAATGGPFVHAICAFVESAIGLRDDTYAPSGKQYYQELIKDRVVSLLNSWARNPLGEGRNLNQYFSSQDSVIKRPMTSLRDVDEAGYIVVSRKDLKGKKLDEEAVKRVMRFIRRGVAEDEQAET